MGVSKPNRDLTLVLLFLWGVGVGIAAAMATGDVKYWDTAYGKVGTT